MSALNKHEPVLLKESIDSLNLSAGDIFVDCTLGGGGHTREVCERFGDKIRIVAIDADNSAIENARLEMPSDCRITFVEENFRNLEKILSGLGIKEVNGILIDLGLSSNQLEHSGRGFSFKRDEPLLMTFGFSVQNRITAMDVVNTWGEGEILKILSEYGEESFSRRIASGIVGARKNKFIKTTGELVNIIGEAIPRKFQHGRIHFATKTFQAIRIAVNDEIGALREVLVSGFKMLAQGGILSVISFHSLEDREVKVFFKKLKEENLGELYTKKPIVPEREEAVRNPRSRSAKLRVIKKIK